MRNKGGYPSRKGGKRYLTLSIPLGIPRGLRNMFWLLAILLGSNMLTYRYSNKRNTVSLANVSTHIQKIGHQELESDLYLMDKAAVYTHEPERFEQGVKEVGQKLNIPPSWLMAVMFSESKFDPAIQNLMGSGAVGLIQFMPSTAAELGVSAAQIQQMNSLQQLPFVYKYLAKVRDRYGEYKSLADLYLAILYPEARHQDECYVLYAKPSVKYKQNAGLDENRDGRVTVSDIDHRMLRLYPTAYHQKPSTFQFSWNK